VAIHGFVLRRVSALLVCAIMQGSSATGWDRKFATSAQPAQDDAHHVASLGFVRAFSSADEVERGHPVVGRTLDIILGPKDAETRSNSLHSPSGVTTDSSHRVFVADPGGNAVHVFDFIRAKYSRLEGAAGRPITPIALAVDAHDNLYVADRGSRTVLIYDAAGKFSGYLGKLSGGESYFETPASITIDRMTGRIYVSDTLRHMVIIMDEHGKLLDKIGKRGGGDQPGDFMLPGQMAVRDEELFVIDVGNSRIQILDLEGHFRRAINLPYADNRTGLAVDGQGNIYVSDPVLNQIQVFGHDGKSSYLFDPTTIENANFSHPLSMWVDAGRCLYVVDSANNRVGLFQISGPGGHECR
jgi:DNA-binding beta-propeller fold protein YncE